jgi:hypothetical protein
MTYRHNLIVHFFIAVIIILMTTLCLYLPNAEFARGGITAKIILIALSFTLNITTILLYFKSILCSYKITPSSLTIKKLFSKKTVQINEINNIKWQPDLNCIFIYANNSRIGFMSRDYFSNLPNLLFEIHENSKCTLSPNLRAWLYQDLAQFPEYKKYKKNRNYGA